MTGNSIGHWVWRLLPLALLLAAWSVWRGSEIGDSVLPVTIGGLHQDWELAERLTGKPL